jgi:hypothetical protein
MIFGNPGLLNPRCLPDACPNIHLICLTNMLSFFLQDFFIFFGRIFWRAVWLGELSWWMPGMAVNRKARERDYYFDASSRITRAATPLPWQTVSEMSRGPWQVPARKTPGRVDSRGCRMGWRLT